MDEYTPPPIGALVSIENTSDNADAVRDFYASVVGWKIQPMPMGEYDDYVVTTEEGDWVGGVCHRRGPNAEVPGGWIPCFRVDNVGTAIARALEAGGKQIGATRDTGPGSHYAIIEDMNGARISVIDFGVE